MLSFPPIMVSGSADSIALTVFFLCLNSPRSKDGCWCCLNCCKQSLTWLCFCSDGRGLWCAGVSQDDRIHTTCQEEDHECAGRREPFAKNWMFAIGFFHIKASFSRHTNLKAPCHKMFISALGAQASMVKMAYESLPERLFSIEHYGAASCTLSQSQWRLRWFFLLSLLWTNFQSSDFQRHQWNWPQTLGFSHFKRCFGWNFHRLRFSRYAISAVPLGALARVKPGRGPQMGRCLGYGGYGIWMRYTRKKQDEAHEPECSHVC